VLVERIEREGEGIKNAAWVTSSRRRGRRLGRRRRRASEQRVLVPPRRVLGSGNGMRALSVCLCGVECVR